VDFIKLYYKIVSIIKSLVKSLWCVDGGVIGITSLFTLFSALVTIVTSSSVQHQTSNKAVSVRKITTRDQVA
jgi:hypothetical protein